MQRSRRRNVRRRARLVALHHQARFVLQPHAARLWPRRLQHVARMTRFVRRFLARLFRAVVLNE